MVDYFKTLKDDEELKKTINEINKNNKKVREFLIKNKDIFNALNSSLNFGNFGDQLRENSINNLSKTYILDELFELFMSFNCFSVTNFTDYLQRPFKDFLNNPELLNSLLKEHLEKFKNYENLNFFEFSQNIITSNNSNNNKIDEKFIQDNYSTIKDLPIDEVNNILCSRMANDEGKAKEQYYYRFFKNLLKDKGIDSGIDGMLTEVFKIFIEDYNKNTYNENYYEVSYFLLNNINNFDLLFKFFNGDKSIDKLMKFTVVLKEKLENIPPQSLDEENFIPNFIRFELTSESVKEFIENFDENMPMEWNVEFYLKFEESNRARNKIIFR